MPEPGSKNQTGRLVQDGCSGDIVRPGQATIPSGESARYDRIIPFRIQCDILDIEGYHSRVAPVISLDIFPIISIIKGITTLSTPRTAIDLTPHLYHQLRYTLASLPPPPLDASPEALYTRNHAAVAKVAALLPVNADDADLAAQFIAARGNAAKSNAGGIRREINFRRCIII